MEPPKVSIIIINYNSSHFTKGCINSIIDVTKGVLYEIIVVDNNSSDQDFALLKAIEIVPDVKLIRSRINLGFSAGNMLGIQAAHPSSSYYYFLNNDCVLLTDVCSQLAAFMECTPEAALCGAQMLDSSHKEQVTFGYLPTVGNKLLGHWFVRWKNPSLYPLRNKQYNEPLQVPFIMGSTLFFRASVFNTMGGFDLVHFLYVEEEDIAKRLQLKNWKVFLVPDARYIHFNGQSTVPSYHVEKEYYISLFHYFRKYHSFPERVLFRIYYFIKNLKKFRRNAVYTRLAWFILRGSPLRESLRYHQQVKYLIIMEIAYQAARF